MRLVGILLIAALVCAAQIAVPVGAVHPPAAAPPQFDRAAVGAIEMQFEDSVKRLDVNDPIQPSSCAGVYVNGYGMVFTLPLVLATTPTISPFHMTITPTEVVSTRTRKLAHLPALKKAMNQMLLDAFKSLPKLPPNDKIAVGVRVFYQYWEDRTGLPALIVVSADRASALAGNIQTDEQ